MTVITDEVVCAPRAGTLYDVLDLILDRGMVIDAFIRVSLVGIEILKIDARIVVASVDTYLRFAEACNRLDLEHDSRSRTVPEMFGGAGGVAGKAGAKKAARSVGEKVKGALGIEEGEDEENEEGGENGEEETHEEERPRRRAASRTSSSRSSSSRGSSSRGPTSRSSGTRSRRRDEEGASR